MSLVTPRIRQFASDNYAGICPEAWEALQEANHGHVQSYGEDIWTTRAADQLRDLFETRCEVFFTFNGTAANCRIRGVTKLMPREPRDAPSETEEEWEGKGGASF